MFNSIVCTVYNNMTPGEKGRLDTRVVYGH